MNPKHIDILCCPQTRQSLNCEVTEKFPNGSIKTGLLMTRDSKNSYPIINGIPRFVAKQLYTDSFGYEWIKWPKIQFESENMGKPMEGHTRNMFNSICEFSESDLKDKTVVEFGCGPGRFIDLVKNKAKIAVGIDMSIAVEAARKSFQDDFNVLIVQGDILNPPFKNNVFDIGYSIGVLHHTPDPEKAFDQLVNVVKNKGILACVVYSKSGGTYNYPCLRLFRRMHKFLKPFFGNKLSLAYSYFSAYVLYYPFYYLYMSRLGRTRIAKYVHLVERNFIPIMFIPDAKWRLLDVFDAITPEYASTHTPEEMEQWFRQGGCSDIKRTNWCNTSMKGVKSVN